MFAAEDIRSRAWREEERLLLGRRLPKMLHYSGVFFLTFEWVVGGQV